MHTEQGEELGQLRARWLKLPDGVTHPTSHQLLGLAEDAYDLPALNRAFQTRFRRVQRYEMGRYSDAAIVIMRELSEAVDDLRNRAQQPAATLRSEMLPHVERFTPDAPEEATPTTSPPPRPQSPADSAGKTKSSQEQAGAPADDAESSGLYRHVATEALVIRAYAYDYRGVPLGAGLASIVVGGTWATVGISWQVVAVAIAIGACIAAVSWQRITLKRSLGEPPTLTIMRVLGIPPFRRQQAVLTTATEIRLEDRNVWEFDVGLTETTCFAILCLTGSYSSGSILSIRVKSPDATDSLMFVGCSSQFYGRQFKQIPASMIVIREGLKRVDVELKSSARVFG